MARSPQLAAGTARAVITPPVGIQHSFWGAQTHTRATEVDMELWATALVVSDGTTQAAIVDADLGSFPNDLVATIRQAVTQLTGIPGEHLRLSASHTHSSANLSKSWYEDGSEMIPGWVASLVDKIVGAVWQAQRELRPARLAAGVGHSTVAMNRRTWHPGQERVFLGRNRDGFADHAMPVARIDDEHERPIATIVNYGCHPTIMAHLSSRITPDWPGQLRRTVEANVGGVCVFLQAAAGDRHPKESFSSRPEDYRKVGTLIGLEAAKVALGLETLPKQERLVEIVESGAELGMYADEPGDEPDGTVRVATSSVDLPLKELPSLEEAERDAEAKRAALAEAQRGGDPAEISSRMYQAKRSSMMANQARRYTGEKVATCQMQGIRIGGLALVAMPGEPFAEIGVRVREASPFAATMVSGYSNGNFAYVPMRSDYANGGYGVWNSPIGPGGDDAVVEGMTALLKQLV